MCALSRSDRCANCWSMTSRSATSPLRSSSSSASATESVDACTQHRDRDPMPNMPNRSSSAARVAASTGSALSSRTKRSTESMALASSAASTPASFSSATNSLCRKRARGQRQQTRHRHDGLADAGLVHLGGEPLGHILGRQHRVDAACADLVGAGGHPDDAERAGRPADQLADLLSNAISAALSVRSRNTTASTRGTPSSGTSSRRVRCETSRDSDEVPGVSMIVVSISSAAGHSTSRSTTSSGSRLAKSNVRPAVRGRSARWTACRRGGWRSPSGSARAGTR